jgi:hypothetical protein
VTVHVDAPPARASALHLVPFAEAAWHRPRAVISPTPYDPLEFFGAGRLWMVSAGVRVHAGGMPPRMGRYGEGRR